MKSFRFAVFVALIVTTMSCAGTRPQGSLVPEAIPLASHESGTKATFVFFVEDEGGQIVAQGAISGNLHASIATKSRRDGAVVITEITDRDLSQRLDDLLVKMHTRGGFRAIDLATALASRSVSCHVGFETMADRRFRVPGGLACSDAMVIGVAPLDLSRPIWQPC